MDTLTTTAPSSAQAPKVNNNEANNTEDSGPTSNPAAAAFMSHFLKVGKVKKVILWKDYLGQVFLNSW